LAKKGTTGEVMFFSATVKDTKGNAIKGVKAEVVCKFAVTLKISFSMCDSLQWQADGDGVYDVQYPDREEANDRGRVVAEDDGTFCYRGILPTAYPIVSRLIHDLPPHTYAEAHA
jgi:protocatechuate 3,4-dioxygenase beta subunit